MQVALDADRYTLLWEDFGDAKPRVWVWRHSVALAVFLLEKRLWGQKLALFLDDNPFTPLGPEERVRLWMVQSWFDTHSPGRSGAHCEHGAFRNPLIVESPGIRMEHEDDGSGTWSCVQPYQQEFLRRNNMVKVSPWLGFVSRRGALGGGAVRCTDCDCARRADAGENHGRGRQVA